MRMDAIVVALDIIVIAKEVGGDTEHNGAASEWGDARVVFCVCGLRWPTT